ncbi:MAG: hypothetical protein AB7O97_18285 [Planctomycetota bacterium]
MRNLFLALSLLAGTASAQCGTLAITGPGTAGTDLNVAVTGSSAGGLIVVMVGQTTGTTTIDIGPLNLTLGLDTPFFPVPLGRADGNGDVARSFTIPNAITQQIALNAQAAAFLLSIFPFNLSACATNVAAFTVG